MNCDVQSLETAAGQFNALTAHEKRAAMVLYLYHQKNPSLVASQVPAADLLNSAKCIACNASLINNGSMLDAFLVAIERQEAIDAGAAEPTATFNGVRALTIGLNALSDSQLRAIEIWLRCQNA
jgi:hypothetical protein